MPQRSVLVVDDDRDTANSLRDLLKLGGYDVRVAFDPAAAMAAAREHAPDAVLLDIGIDGPLAGLDLCRSLRREPWAKELLIIIITGWTRAEDRENARNAGCDHYLLKPAKFETLDALLQGRDRRK